ncbi:hypothetical protein RFI_15779 [Reticulomyxa filosa]|uniref:Uncharacterized protein n=1 Tax=Reticulomyxa filosa TaxID=46433 RepID=X6N688_RETFI|nr:hypothetical protein RFI_15779 [Reticulomyxa filosa]|eukprot:ETO21423.1 hypothetical protein RFI_15779 [Reticulomyxa filosa]
MNLELEREVLECKARLQMELKGMIEEVDIKFKEFEMQLDRCLMKQCLRVQKHRQVIEVYQTQTRLHRLEDEDENSPKAVHKDSCASFYQEEETVNTDGSDDNPSATAKHKNKSNRHTNDGKDTTNNVGAIESKITSEQKLIEKISMEKEFEQFHQKVSLLNEWVNTL